MPKHVGSTRNKIPGKRGTTTKTIRGHQDPQVAPPLTANHVFSPMDQTKKRVRNILVDPLVQRSNVNHAIQIQKKIHWVVSPEVPDLLSMHYVIP